MACLDIKLFIIRHYKAIILVVSIGLFVLSIVAKAHADPIDSAHGP